MGDSEGQPKEHRVWAYSRRKFTRTQVRMLLASDYHGFAKSTGVKLSTARRYGNLIRHSSANDLTIVTDAPKPHKNHGRRQPEPVRSPSRTTTTKLYREPDADYVMGDE